MSNYQGPGRYRHYKGGEYEVIGLAVRENSYDPGNPANAEYDVVYRHVNPTVGMIWKGIESEFWTRPLGDFNEQVIPEGAVPCSQAPRVPRFQQMRRIQALYFGTYRDSGHYWRAGSMFGDVSGGRALREWISKNLPWGEIVDGKLYKEGPQSRCLLYHRDGWTAIAFPHRLDDNRGGCNGNFFFDTTLTFEQAVEEARRQFPQVMALIDEQAPLYLHEDQRGQVPA